MPVGPTRRSVEATPKLLRLLREGAAVAVGVSGGRDGQAAALDLAIVLDQAGHTGPRILIHSDLGLVEWRDSLPSCQRLAERLGWELVVVRRRAGGMMDRWEGRWLGNRARYQELRTVTLLLPWSTAKLRYCTSELKVQVIQAELRRRFPHLPIVSCTGIRREESPRRRQASVVAPAPALCRERLGLAGFTWNPILGYRADHVAAASREAGLRLHEGYTRYLMTRISCAFCILASRGDLERSAACPDHHGLYRRMVALEIQSTFAFQPGGWLGDVAPDLLSPETREALEEAKLRAAIRKRLEAPIPPSMRYVKGWPTRIPTSGEAEVLAEVRSGVGTLLDIPVLHTSTEAVLARYHELMEEKEAAAARKRSRPGARAAAADAQMLLF